MSNTYRDKNNVLRFKIPQHYMVPINDAVEGSSVTTWSISAKEDTPILPFFRAFRKVLSKYVPVVQYCHLANFHEVLQCVDYPDPK